MCYKTGQIYLLLTELARLCNGGSMLQAGMEQVLIEVVSNSSVYPASNCLTPETYTALTFFRLSDSLQGSPSTMIKVAGFPV
jgi:hypothetical protein